MANIDAPFGLRPIAKLGSAPGGTTGTTKYKISSGASALFTGDPVKLKADGSIEVKGGAGAITGAISGVFMGCFYTDPTTSNTCLLYTSPSPRDRTRSRMPSSA